MVPRVGSGNSSAQQAMNSTGRHIRTGNCPKDTDSPKIWAVVGEDAYQLTVGKLLPFWSGEEPVSGEFQHQLILSKNSGAEAFAHHCNSLFSGAKVKVSAKGGCVKMTGEMESGRKERLALPYTLP